MKMHQIHRYMSTQKVTCLLFFVLMIASRISGSLFSLVMSSLVDCAGKSTQELVRILLGSIAFVTVSVSLELFYYYVKTKLLTNARYGLKRDLFAGIMNRSEIGRASCRERVWSRV